MGRRGVICGGVSLVLIMLLVAGDCDPYAPPPAPTIEAPEI